MSDVIEATPPAVFQTSGNFVKDTAQEVAGLSRDEALKQALDLSGSTYRDLFKLGGLLKKIKDEKWFPQHQPFIDFAFEKFGYKKSQVYGLISGYEHLVASNISEEQIKGIGWSHLSMLAPVVTQDNVGMLVKKAKTQTVKQFKATILKETSHKTSADKLLTAETVKPSASPQPVAVIPETVAPNPVGYLATYPELTAAMKAAGWEPTLTVFGLLFPSIDLTIDPPNA